MWDDWYRNTKAGEMTPTEFEQYCKEILERFAQKENLQDFVILHDVHLESNDGNYQIDVFAEFRALGVSFKVLCECKQYKNRVSREKVAVLESKVLAPRRESCSPQPNSKKVRSNTRKNTESP